ncbi:hypothetical protein WJR50_12275 [Catalinimonas sp. 4WD22]|uniref:hypothetical protein n=1 Tax=Catalinimonas locisalis TaxID=3133978 RepID=UPI0031011EA5
MGIRFYWFLAMLGLPCLSIAQIVQPDRIEIEVESTSNEFVVVSADENGLLIFRDSEERNPEGKHIWEFHKYNTALKQEWRRDLAIESDYILRGYDYDKGQLCVLFQDGPYQDRRWPMLNMSVETGDTVQHFINRVAPVNLEYFEIVGQTVVLGGQINYKPVVIHYDMLTSRLRALPGIYQENGELIDIIPNENDNTFDVLIGEMNDNRVKTVTLKAYDQYSNLLQSAPLNTEDRKNLLDAQVTEFDGEKQFLAGTYGPRRSRYSRGIFIASVQPNGEQDIKYYNYGDLNNFFNYMRDKREARIKRRIERRKQKNKKLKFNYRMVIHELIADNGKYILLGEAYYPKYNSYYYSGFYGGYPSRYDNMYFDGYRFTHAIAVCFDRKGNLLWDHAFKLDNVKSMQLKQLVHVNVQNDSVVLMYSYEKEITTKVIRNNGEYEETTTKPIKLANESDTLKNKNDSEIAGIEKWYGEYFYVHGTQDIKNSQSRSLDLKRKVFFINKVAYDGSGS